MKNAVKLWGVKNADQLDPAIRYLIEIFSTLNYDVENNLEDIRERLVEQISNVLTPDNLIAVKPAHSVLKVMPLEPELTIGKQDLFYTSTLTAKAVEYGLKTLSFAPVVNHIKLFRGAIKSLLCERNLYQIGIGDEKELVTRANAFYQDLNRTVYVGFDLDAAITDLKGIHFYLDFANTPSKHELFELLDHTVWSIGGKEIAVESGLPGERGTKRKPGGIFAHYHTLNLNDEEVMELYRKQFLYINESVYTRKLEKYPFPPELIPYFPERVKAFDPQYWLKIQFSPYFKAEDIDELNIFMNSFVVSNKDLRERVLDRQRDITGILPLRVESGEYFLAVENVEDSQGNPYKFLPYSSTESPLGGVYTVKRGGSERFSTRSLKDLIERTIDLMRSELSVFTVLKLDNIGNSVTEIHQFIAGIKDKIEHNNSMIKEVPTYLLIENEDEEKKGNIEALYWVTNADVANEIIYGTQLEPLKVLPLEKDSCYLLRTTTGGKLMPKEGERLTAYKYALTTRNQLFSARDIENYCYMKYGAKIALAKVVRGIAAGNRQKHGLVRTVDVLLTPVDEYRELFDATTIGELKLELEKRSPTMYNYRVIVK